MPRYIPPIYLLSLAQTRHFIYVLNVVSVYLSYLGIPSLLLALRITYLYLPIHTLANVLIVSIFIIFNEERRCYTGTSLYLTKLMCIVVRFNVKKKGEYIVNGIT